jgi:hypothetical protein
MAYSGFNQRAYKYLPDANEQLQAYLQNFPESKGWNQGLTDELKAWVQSVNDDNDHWYGGDVTQFWKDIAVGFWPAVERITDNDPSKLQNVDAVNNILGGASQLSEDIEESEGVSGAVNILGEHIQERAQAQGSINEKILKYALGLGALFVVVKAIK